MKGLIFSIEEFAVFDGDGIRVNVFFKGCPLRCKWCHNPEGFEFKQQIVKNVNTCVNCGICKQICSEATCKGCLKCVNNCPKNALRVSGYYVTVSDLAKKLLSFEKFFTQTNGGVTFSGGEVLLQPDFLYEVLSNLPTLNKAIETSGYGDSEKFKKILTVTDFVFFDLKIMDSKKHKLFTGKSNKLILKNAKILLESNVPCTIRIPFIHGVNTDQENLESLCKFIENAPNLKQVEFLSYNKMAGAKYKMLGKSYKQEFVGPTDDDLTLLKQIFEKYNIKYTVSL